MNILIVIPPIRDFYFTPHRGSFLGVEIVKKILLKNRFNVKILNLINLKKKPKNINLPHYLNYLSEYLNKGLFFKTFKHFGISYEEAVNLIIKSNPDVVILSCFAFCYAEETIALAKKLKEKQPNLFIAAGGSGVSVFPEFFEKTELFDLIICGEFESIYNEVIDYFEKKKTGIIYPKIFCNNDELEFTLKLTFKTNKITYLSTILSRGCPKNCSFCANFLVFGKKFKTVSIKKIEKELKQFKISGEKIFVNFEDDNILFAKEYLWEVLELFKKYFKNVLFSFENGIDYMLLEENDIKILVDYGIRQFNFSFVNLSPKILKTSFRISKKEKLEEIVNIIKKFNIPIIVYIIAGLKNDSFQNIVENLLFLSKLKVILGYSPFYPVPGIKDFTIKEKFYNYPPGLLRGSAMYPWYNSVSTSDLIRGFEIARALNLSYYKLQ